jgi:Bacterial regulatory helix-turn-helix protein, lysR family
MTLQQIRYFLALCEAGNFTHAAKRCGVAQPSLTRAIKELEAEFGGPLFVRNGRTSQLSSLGKVVQPYLADIDRAAGRAKSKAADFLAAPSRSTRKPKETPMRKMIFGLSITAIVLLVAGLAVHPPKSADATQPAQASEVTDVYQLAATIDIKALPRQDILSEADE